MSNAPPWRPKLTLSDADLTQLHDAAISILAATGVDVLHADMRRTLVDAGARAGDGARIRFAGDMVDRALETAPSDIVIYDRLGVPAMPLVPHRIFFGTGSDLVHTMDGAGGGRRLATLDDVGHAARLCDALDEIDFVMSFALPHNVQEGETEPHQYNALVSNTTKPVIMTSFSGLDSLARVHEMACALAGGDEAFRQQPNYILYSQFVSPLQQDELAVNRLVFCADHEIPLIHIPTIMPGASGPITLAGSLAQATAECLAGLVLHQTRRPGAPFIFGACVSQLDMRTMLFPYGTPEWRLNDLVMAQLARHYGLPVFGTGGSTDSKVVDAQAGMESALGLLVAALAGTNLIHDVGYLESGLTGSLESIVMGAEQIRWIRQLVDGMAVSADTLALETIDEVGPAHHFLDREHTLQHLRDSVHPPLVADRVTHDRWVQDGARDYATRARQHARGLVDGHRPAPLGASMERTLRNLCRRPTGG